MRVRGNGGNELEQGTAIFQGRTAGPNTTANNCTGNSDCPATCCLRGQCAFALSVCSSHPIDTTKVLCVMAVVFAILLGIVIYVRCISNKYTIKAMGPYMGKHTYLSRKSHLPRERLIPPAPIQLKLKSALKSTFAKHSSLGGATEASV